MAFQHQCRRAQKSEVRAQPQQDEDEGEVEDFHSMQASDSGGARQCESDRQAAFSQVDLFEALGGGWQDDGSLHLHLSV
ncbi:hypothetical protein [Stenotrophomonas indicatrix]|uniref:hypothetical protein n=1 Tax=Stenotrophomonas indicatrix TaxID=2045451 RepID=UPI00111B4E85|nr:hypothetical protein [Stenotrophomonas indicatrix]MDN8648328.1 hypothetical protein [Stenotrophomonas indicatrix]